MPWKKIFAQSSLFLFGEIMWNCQDGLNNTMPQLSIRGVWHTPLCTSLLAFRSPSLRLMIWRSANELIVEIVMFVIGQVNNMKPAFVSRGVRWIESCTPSSKSKSSSEKMGKTSESLPLLSEFNGVVEWSMLPTWRGWLIRSLSVRSSFLKLPLLSMLTKRSSSLDLIDESSISWEGMLVKVLLCAPSSSKWAYFGAWESWVHVYMS